MPLNGHTEHERKIFRDMGEVVKDILSINNNKSFLTYIHKRQLATIIEKANNNEGLSKKDYFYIKEMKKRIKVFLVSNEMRVNTRLKRITRDPLTSENKQRNSTFKRGRTSFSGHYNSNGDKI